MQSQFPVTQAQLQKELAAFEARITERLTEVMRDMQTEMLRAMEGWTTALTARLVKVEANHSTLDTTISVRMATIEKRLFEIEKRLLLNPPPEETK